MKTKNNVQKAILKSVAVITSLVLISITVNAQGSFKEMLADNSFGTIAKVLTEKPLADGDYNISSATLENEPDLEIENWMLSDNSTEFDFNYEVTAEPTLELENWMTDNVFDSFLKLTQEEKLNLESWMLQ